MAKQRNRIAIAIVLVWLALACSPGLIMEGLVGNGSTVTPPSATLISSSSTQIPQSTATRDSSAATAIPTRTESGIPAIMPTSATTPTLTNTPPPVLPLRTDLPGLKLQDWPRPANDNGRCFHFLPTGYYTPTDMKVQIERLLGLQARWVLALYADENQLRLAAQSFSAAKIVPVWRKTLRAYQRYYAWDRDIKILADYGLPPYFQLYNEPDMLEEWDGKEINREQWVAAFVQTAKDLFNAGGYVGIQTLDEEWLKDVLRTVKAQKGERLFQRMFFVPHPYGLNHPPNYVEDENGVLGYRVFAQVFQEEIGFVPPFIAGEGGWKFQAAEDDRFPKIDDKLHAKYHVELFDWFRLRKVSDGQPLPDFLFAFCPWILAAQLEGAAWYDSFEANREQTIADVKKIPIFTRKFSWDK